MKTNFSVIQLQDRRIAEADKILKSCQHYGFCTSGCPTYVLLRDELDSPRGRIDLIKDMLEKGGAPDAKTVGHLDKCLSCGSCVTTCAVKVDYPHLIDHAREYIELHFRRPFMERLLRALIAFTVPRPRIFRLAITSARLAEPLAAVFPKAFAPLFQLAKAPLPPSKKLLTTYHASGERRYRVALLAGCAQKVLAPEINEATIRLLNAAGCDVVIPAGVGCCGSLALHMGRTEEAKTGARTNIKEWMVDVKRMGLDAILVNASGCGTTIKDYAHMLADDKETAVEAAAVSRLTKDVTEWLAKIGIPKAPNADIAYTVVYHDPCSIRNIQKVTSQPRKLLKNAGFHVTDVPEGHFCCGSAGTFNMLQPALAEELGKRKAENLESTQASIAATANIGCLTQIRQYTALPLVHVVQLLDWAYGGPMPSQLRETDLKRYEVKAVEPIDIPVAELSSEEDAGIW